MNALKFIEVLEQRKLVHPSVTNRLRTKVGTHDKPVSAESVAKLLVEKGHLTRHQAKDAIQVAMQSIADEEEILDIVPDDDDVPEWGKKKSTPSSPRRGPLVGSHDAAVSDGETKIPDDGGDTKATASDPEEEDMLAVELVEIPDAEPHDLPKEIHRPTKIRHPPPPPKSEWDSPIILYGGGGLLVLLLLGGLIWFLLFKDTGDARYQAAIDDIKNGAYTQAIAGLERFVSDFPSHDAASEARVQLAVARLRQATEGTTDYDRALGVAEQELPRVEEEEAFQLAREELAALLPAITKGLAEQAAAADDVQVAANRYERAMTALAMVNNTSYVPKSQRPDEVIEQIRQTLATVERRRERARRLEEALTEIAAAVAQGDIKGAYEVRADIALTHAELLENERLKEAIQTITRREQTAVQRSDAGRRATGEVTTQSVESQRLTVSNPLAAGAVLGALNYVRVDGAVYAIDDAGHVGWRQFVGFGSATAPIAVPRGVIVSDLQRGAVTCLDAADGHVRWSQQLPPPIQGPVAAGDRVFAIDREGRLVRIQANDGSVDIEVSFPLSSDTAPAISADGKWVVVVGRHSTIYVLNAETLACTATHYLGHEEGAIAAAPVVVGNYVVIAENIGEASCRIRLLQIGGAGEIVAIGSPTRLPARVTTSPLAWDEQVAVITERGSVFAFEIIVQEEKPRLEEIASQAAGAINQAATYYAALVGRDVWVAGRGLSHYAILPTGGRIEAIDTENAYGGDAFVHPLVVQRDRVLTVRKLRRAAGHAVAAVNPATGKTLFNTYLSTPPAAPPLPRNGGLLAADVNGTLYRFADGQRQWPVQIASAFERLAGVTPSQPLSAVLTLADATTLYASDGINERLLVADLDQNDKAWWVLPEAAECPPLPFGPGIVMGIARGQLLWLRPRTTKSISPAYQAPWDVQRPFQWSALAAVDSQRVVAAESNGALHLVSVNESNPLERIAHFAGGDRGIATRLAVAGDRIAFGTPDGVIRCVELPGLEQSHEAKLAGEVVWGPFETRDSFLAVSGAKELVCLDGQLKRRWETPIGNYRPVGRPMTTSTEAYIALQGGKIVAINLETGKPRQVADVQQPLASGPVRVGTSLVCAAYDGTLLLVNP